MIKKTTMAILIALASGSAFAEKQNEENINYGDPTASFSTVGVSASKDSTQLNGMMGFGSNIFLLDLGRDNKSGDLNYRGKYFHVTEGLGYSVDIIGSEKSAEGSNASSNSNTALAGLIYKMQLTDNISIFPMASVGYTQTKFKYQNNTKSESSALGQVGLYAMYGFDAGHWVYINPKSTYNVKQKEFIHQVEIGAGLMVLDNASIGTKIEYTAKNTELKTKEDTVAWLQGNIYF